MPLILEVEPGQAVRIGAGTIVRVLKKKGQKARLEITSEYKISLDHGGDRLERPDPTKAAAVFDRPKGA